MPTEEPIVDARPVWPSFRTRSSGTSQGDPVGTGAEGIASTRPGGGRTWRAREQLVTGVGLDGEPEAWQAGTGREPYR